MVWVVIRTGCDFQCAHSRANVHLAESCTTFSNFKCLPIQWILWSELQLFASNFCAITTEWYQKHRVIERHQDREGGGFNEVNSSCRHTVRSFIAIFEEKNAIHFCPISNDFFSLGSIWLCAPCALWLGESKAYDLNAVCSTGPLHRLSDPHVLSLSQQRHNAFFPSRSTIVFLHRREEKKTEKKQLRNRSIPETSHNIN